jgi:hypothetical protein
MKRFFLLSILTLFAFNIYSQDIKAQDLKATNTWLKLGLNLGIPLGGLADVSTVNYGPEISIQYLKTKAFGIGLTAGYNLFTGKDPVENFSTLPLAVLFRYYPESTGFFSGLEVGYAFINNVSGTSGGTYTKPHIGWHTDNWNFTAYYSYILTEDEVVNFETIGVGVSYNLRFKPN